MQTRAARILNSARRAAQSRSTTAGGIAQRSGAEGVGAEHYRPTGAGPSPTSGKPRVRAVWERGELFNFRIAELRKASSEGFSDSRARRRDRRRPGLQDGKGSTEHT